MDIQFIKTLRNYKKTIAQKNAALKKRDYSLLSTYNTLITRYGIEIMKFREKVCLFFNQKIQGLFSHIFNKEDQYHKITMEYIPSWKTFEYDVVMNNLSQQMNEEKRTCFCLSGPHRDKIAFSLSGYPFKEIASTGQVRLLSLLIRAVQAEYYYTHTNKRMVYLFDDVLLELDAVKRSLFLQSLPKATQHFFTFLPDEKLPDAFFSKASIYTVENGTLTAQ